MRPICVCVVCRKPQYFTIEETDTCMTLKKIRMYVYIPHSNPMQFYQIKLGSGDLQVAQFFRVYMEMSGPDPRPSNSHATSI